MSAADSTAAIETVFRLEFGRLVSSLARYVGDVSLGEELAQEALVDALEQWQDEGIPRNPGAWLMTVGRERPSTCSAGTRRWHASTRRSLWWPTEPKPRILPEMIFRTIGSV